MRRIKLLGAVAALTAVAALVSPAASAAANPVEKASFQGRHTSRCLDGYAAARVHTNPCNGGNFQNFYWNTTPTIDTPLASVQEANKCLQAEGVQVWLKDCRSGARAQRWNLNKGVTTIRTADTGRCLSRTGEFGAIVQLEDCNGLQYQQWVVTA